MMKRVVRYTENRTENGAHKLFMATEHSCTKKDGLIILNEIKILTCPYCGEPTQ